jgi:hypothetical protein
MVNEMNKCNANERTRRYLKQKEILNKIRFYLINLLTFSSFDGEETEGDEFPLNVDVAGKRSRFNRIVFVSFVDVVSFDETNSKRLVIDGDEHGNVISMAKIMICLINIDFLDDVRGIYLIENPV